MKIWEIEWSANTPDPDTRVVVIEFWHGFMDYNYLSLNRQLLPLQLPRLLTGNDCNYGKMTKLQITLFNYRLK